MTQGQMTRRQVSGAAAAAIVLTASSAKAAPGQRPNILWLVSEDNNPFIGAYGDKLARTPTIDGLAQKGVLFRNVYSSAPVCAPSRFGILTGIYPEACAPANHMRAEASLPSEFKTYPELLRAAGYYCTNNAKTDYNSTVEPARIWDGSNRDAHWRNRPDARPFMAVFNYETTHESQIFRPTAGRVTPDQPRIPAYLPDTPGVRGDYASYYNLIERMDGQLAARLTELEADGLADETIVFYYSDNGGVLPRSKRYCYDEGLRCAMVVYAPPKWAHLLTAPPGSVVEARVNLIDLPPTVLSLAGLEAPKQMQGAAFLGPKRKAPQTYAFGMRNRMDERYDFVRTVSDGRWRYIRNYMPHRPWGMHGAYEWLAKGYQDWERVHLAGTLTPAQARFFQTKPYEELYDLRADPDQIADLAAAPASRKVLRKLSNALDAHMMRVQDNGFIPEGMKGEGYWPSRDKNRYPLAKVMALAASAARGEAGQLATFRQGLGEQNEVLRYWNAMGLLILGPAARPALADLAATLRSDPSPHVRVVAAEATAKLGDEGEAVAALATLSAPPNPWPIQLQAMNALTALGLAAAPAKAAIAAAATSPQPYVRSTGRYLTAVLDGTYDPSYRVFNGPGA